MSQQFSGAEFIKALGEGGLKEGFIREGMVKQEENDPNAVQFSEGTDCSLWTKIPVGMVEQVEFLRFVSCRDHSHPFVRLHLKAPGEGSEAAVFAALLKNALPGGGFRVSRQEEARMSAVVASDLKGGASGGRVSGSAMTGMTGGGFATPQPSRTRAKARSSAARTGENVAGSGVVARADSLGEGWIFVNRFGFDEINACFYLLEVEVLRRPNAGRWDYRVIIDHGGVLQGGSCDCFLEYRTGTVRARVDGTGGGYLDTGDLDVHSGGGSVWQDFSSVYPGELQHCNVSWNTWCTT
jgi:hypothetical protein